MDNTLYKVLDVRESMFNISGHTSSLNNDTSIHYTRLYIVIAENIQTRERERFEFYRGHTSTFLDKEHYCGYSGDFGILIKDDIFEIIRKPDDYDQVLIV